MLRSRKEETENERLQRQDDGDQLHHAMPLTICLALSRKFRVPRAMYLTQEGCADVAQHHHSQNDDTLDLPKWMTLSLSIKSLLSGPPRM